MKLVVNYDLIAKITEANTGLSLKRTTAKILFCTAAVTIITTPIIKDPFAPEVILRHLATQTIYNGIIDLLFVNNSYKNSAKQNLKILSLLLKTINVNTSYELLLNSHKYDTTYEFETTDSSIPKIIQKKYIMVPVLEGGEEKEVSLVQEHIIGTKKYSLAFGSPTKVLKLAANPI